MVKIGNKWDEILKDCFEDPKYLELHNFLKQEYREHTIYPNMYDIFNALKMTDFDEVKVVIVGQDPYHEPGQAHGLAFSVLCQELPPSLKNIYKEIENEYGYKMNQKGDLTAWAKQGVLLLNNVLTVRAHQANSHKNKGWEFVTDSIMEKLNQRDKPVIFVFWGNNAKTKEKLITNDKHYILKSAHPSPLSAYAGFFGNGHFKKINELLVLNKEKEIDWRI